MALPSSGVMKASMIQAELGESGSWSINSQSSRALAKVPSGTIKFSDFYGKVFGTQVTNKYYIKESWGSKVKSVNIPDKLISGTLTMYTYGKSGGGPYMHVDFNNGMLVINDRNSGSHTGFSREVSTQVSNFGPGTYTWRIISTNCRYGDMWIRFTGLLANGATLSVNL